MQGNCGYGQMEDLGCTVMWYGARSCGYTRMEDLGCAEENA